MKHLSKGNAWLAFWLVAPILAIVADHGIPEEDMVSVFISLLVLTPVLFVSVMMGYYFLSHVRKGRYLVAAGVTTVGFLKSVVDMKESLTPEWTFAIFMLLFWMMVGSLLQSIVSKVLGPKMRPNQAPGKASDQASWVSLGLTRVGPQGAEGLAIQGRARPTLEFEHGGFTDQYIEFAPSSTYLATWTPERLEVFLVSDGSSLGSFPERAFVGFSPSEQALFLLHGASVERYELPSLALSGSPVSVEGTHEEWACLKKTTLYSRRSGFVVTDERTVEFPYRARVHAEKALLAYSVSGSVMVETLNGDPVWQSPDAGRDVTSVGFSPDGSQLCYATMGGSLLVADLEKKEILQRCLADGEIRCLAVSSEGLVAVGCADASSKIWVYNISHGELVTVIEPGGDVWSLAFSDDGKRLASGHESGKVRLWSRSDLPKTAWVRLS